MKPRAGIAQDWKLLAVEAVVVCWFFAFTTSAQAQGSQGQDAVYNPSSGIVGSSAFIDANTFLNPVTQGKDLCDAIFYIFTHNYPSTGAVVDARGISGATNLTCTHGTPWTEGNNTVTVPSTILLPAGTIIIPGTWVLPNYTRLVGAGDALDYLSTGTVSVGTTLQACKSSINGCSFNSNETDMIDLGTSPLCGPACNSVSVENLTLDGLGQSLSSPQCLVS